MKSSSLSTFFFRHIGLATTEQATMLAELGYADLDRFTADVLPDAIKNNKNFELNDFSEALSEEEWIQYVSGLASSNQVFRSYIGCGYYANHVPAVIQRNILENPGWYTQYTPYQPEISQGRLEALLNYQTMVISLTGLDIANASLLDEASAAAEAMYMALNVVAKKNKNANKFFVDQNIFPQTLAVLNTRAKSLSLEIVVGDYQNFQPDAEFFGVLLQYPAANGEVPDYQNFIAEVKQQGLLVCMATDLLALCLLKSPAELGADIAFGSAQRFGVPMGFGGPHAAFFACRQDYQRLMPGRLVGVSKDRLGNAAYRLSLQTREQHIRRDKATSNICTAQVLLAIMSGMYAVYHGPQKLKEIGERVNKHTAFLRQSLIDAGFSVINESCFDTLTLSIDKSEVSTIKNRAQEFKINFFYAAEEIRISLDETIDFNDLADILFVLTGKNQEIYPDSVLSSIPADLKRSSEFLEHEVFNSYHTETEFLRYLKKLEAKDLSLANSMIPLGSCTMKLNATTEMLPVTWKEFAAIHPLVPAEQVKGYQELITKLETALKDITGFDAVSLQPNAGSQGEYAGLIAIRGYLDSIGQGQRNTCLIPKSAHGTNPASAVIAGLQVVAVECDESGNIDIDDLKSKAEQYQDTLAALMITYPSTHGVFEEAVKEICSIIHAAGGQVYLDGANLNALVGCSFPAELGADVMHINLHKTFCIPHGGGGPGVGPVAAKEHLKEFLPADPQANQGKSYGAVSAAMYGSASILPISLAYIAMMGAVGLKKATQVAILNANYIAKKLDKYYPVLFKGKNGFVAHECILDCREFKKFGIEVEDIAKRLIDYGFHAPTVSWPVIGTIMIEPTESESKKELDRFIDAMMSIYHEIQDVASGKYSQDDNPLKGAPHTATELVGEWNHPYSREIAVYPTEELKRSKFWPAVARIDGVYGDRNLVCSCTLTI